MKRVIVTLLLLVAGIGLKAQNCDAMLLPFFGFDAAKMAACPDSKQELICLYARAALYESDTVPDGADILNINEVVNIATGQNLPADYVVDLNTMGYYTHNFRSFQYRYPHGDKVLCFSTPNSRHPYLVLRSIEQIDKIANEQWMNR